MLTNCCTCVLLILCREQEELKSQLVELDSDEVKSWKKGAGPFSDLRHVAGVDISFDKEHPTHACAMLAILSFPDLKVCHSYVIFFVMVYMG